MSAAEIQRQLNFLPTFLENFPYEVTHLPSYPHMTGMFFKNYRNLQQKYPIIIYIIIYIIIDLNFKLIFIKSQNLPVITG